MVNNLRSTADTAGPWWSVLLLKGVRQFGQMVAAGFGSAILLSDVQWRSLLTAAAAAALSTIVLNALTMIPAAEPQPATVMDGVAQITTLPDHHRDALIELRGALADGAADTGHVTDPAVAAPDHVLSTSRPPFSGPNAPALPGGAGRSVASCHLLRAVRGHAPLQGSRARADAHRIGRGAACGSVPPATSPRESRSVKRSGDGRLEAWAVEHVTVFRIGMVTLAAIVGLVEIGTRFGLKWIPTWADSGGLTLMVVGTFSEGIWGIRRAKRRRSEEGRQLDLEKQMVSVLVSIAKLTGIDVDIPGCNVWSIRGTREMPLLHREYRRRLSDFPQPSPVEWTQGKGVIGRCWQEGETLHQDWRPAQEKWAGKEQVSDTEWKGMSARERWGFDRTEYLRSIRKYAEILAVPIKDDDGHTLGVLSVDIPTDRSNGGAGCLAGGDVREVLTHAAISLRSFV